MKNINELASRVKPVHLPYTSEQVKDADFVHREIGRLGFSMSITYSPIDMVNASRVRSGKPALTAEEHQAVGDGGFTFQLLGGPIQRRGEHASPVCPNMNEMLATALFNVLNICHQLGKIPTWPIIQLPT